MAENDGSPSTSSSAPPLLRPTIVLPPRTSMESLFTGGGAGPGASPGPMTLVSNFFSDNDPDSDCRSFSQLLAGAMASPAAAVRREDFSGQGSGDLDFRFKQNRPSGLMIAQSPMFTVPPGLSPTSLFESPRWFSPGQGHFGMSHQQALAQVTAQAHSEMQIQAEFQSSLTAASGPPLQLVPYFTNNAASQQHMQPSMPDSTIIRESSDVSHSDHRSHASSLVVDKPADDGYNWRKYGQKQVKGSEYPRSYYKCTSPNCPVKKKVERSLDGQVTEIIYKGQHNHQPPQTSKRAKEAANLGENSNHQGNYELAMEGRAMPAYSLLSKDQESSRATSGSSDSGEVGDNENRGDERDDDEPEAKRRNTELRVSDHASSQRTVAEPRIIVQTTSEVDLLDDGYRWRKYGQKIVKGNPYPRSYYKCTSQGCNVRKHVERAASDPKAVITTYEGKHNHDPPAARNSSHNTANNNNTLQLKPQNAPVSNRHNTSGRQPDYANNDSQPIPLLRFKEELT